MKRQVEIEGRIRQLQDRINAYMAEKGCEEYEELLRLSRELDRLLTEWIKAEKHWGQGK